MNATLARRGLPTLLAAAVVLLALGATGAAPPARAAEEFNPWAQRLAPADTDRVIVKLKGSDRATALAATGGTTGGATGTSNAATSGAGGTVSTERMSALGARTGVAFAKARNAWGDVYVARVDGVISVGGLEAAIAKLRADPDVEYAEPDARMHAHFAVNDPRAAAQWYLQPVAATSSGQTLSAINAVGAWDVTQGSASVIVAVLDTGVRFDHPDLTAKFLPGRDFVSGESATSFKNANDGDDWDADASDPGDWISAADLTDSVFNKCGGGPNEDQPTDSSWHGTRVSGIIGASTNNALGIAGIGFNTRILPVRVLGKCGGSSSDIIAGMRWAAGLAVNGVPTNTTNRAKVLNLSLGGTGTCTASYQSAVDEIVAAGVLVVASAGNEGLALDRPANCRGVLSVGAVRHAGTKVGFSNLGSNLAISAPGGNCVNSTGPCLFSIDTTSNDGRTTPGSNIYTDQNNANVGTSFSAPIAAGASALLYAANANLTPAQAIARLKATAHAFPAVTTVPQCRVPTSGTDTQTSECSCTTRTCGAGMVDAGGLLAGANAPQAAFTTSGTILAGSPVLLDAATSSAGTGSTIASYAWSVRPGATGTPTFTAPTASSTQVSTSATGSLAIQLVVTDSLGRTSTAIQNIFSAVPNLDGLTRAAAEAALLNADLALGLVSTQPASAPAGNIVSQNPAPGSAVPSGSVVGIVISGGPQQITVPDVVNQTQTNAQSTLTNTGLTVGTITQQTSATVASGSVISQSPAAGTSVTAGSAVALVVSTGPAATGGGSTGGGGAGGGGGGGAMDAPTLVVGALLALGAVWGRRRRELVRRGVRDGRPR